MINDSGNKVVAILKRGIKEIDSSQSSDLATGWLEFERKRFLDILNLAKVEIESSNPADFPESHPATADEIVIDGEEEGQST